MSILKAIEMHIQESIYDAVVTNPGISLESIAKNAKVPLVEVENQLSRFKSMKLLKEDGGSWYHRDYVIAKSNVEIMHTKEISPEQIREHVVSCITLKQGIGISVLKENLGIHNYKLVQDILTDLADKNHILIYKDSIGITRCVINKEYSDEDKRLMSFILDSSYRRALELVIASKESGYLVQTESNKTRELRRKMIFGNLSDSRLVSISENLVVPNLEVVASYVASAEKFGISLPQAFYDFVKSETRQKSTESGSPDVQGAV